MVNKMKNKSIGNFIEIEFCIENAVGDDFGEIQKGFKAIRATKLAGDGRVAPRRFYVY